MSEQLRVFESAEFGTVRTVEMNGEPWFVAVDVARALEYQNGSRDINRHIDEEDRKKFMLFDGSQSREAIAINESGVYALILSSKLPAAKKFKHWVTSEVLPAIRQHGAYMTDATLERALNEPDFLISLATKLKEEREARKALELDKTVLTQQVAELKPKASYYDLVLQCPGLLSMTEIAKDYGMSAKAMNKRLHELGVQFNQAGVWFLYARYQSEGYTQTKTQNFNKPDGSQGTRTHMYWTQKGRVFLYYLLKEQGILPMMERDAA
nr:MAG TPA: repressor domain protein [Caudoviricetes sp.]